MFISILIIKFATVIVTQLYIYNMFDEICSIYSDALDNVGRYVDRETGECIQQMTIREFCLTDRWKPYVQHLRAMRKEYGSKAKKMQEYIDTKKHLPGATLSGLFSIYDDECIHKDGSKFIAPVSRRETHLKQHTGWLAIDIDLDDNKHLTQFNNVRFVCQYRPEIGLLMRSCSGSGYFGLVRLAYPDRHKDQFKALLKDYAACGITLDRSCGNIGRVRFASWDDPEHIYINEKATAYTGLNDQVVMPLPLSRQYHSSYAETRHGSSAKNGVVIGDWHNDTPEIVYRKVKRLVEKVEQQRVDLMSGPDAGYIEWVYCGMSLYHLVGQAGYDFWKRVSRFRPADSTCGHHESDFAKRWPSFAQYSNTKNFFFKQCMDKHITLTRDDLLEIYG